MESFRVLGPEGSRPRLAAMLTGTAFQLEDEIFFDDRPLTATPLVNYVDGARLIQELSDNGVRTVTDVQRLDPQYAWRVFHEVSRLKRRAVPPFTTMCRIMAGRKLRFTNGLRPADLLMGRGEWIKRYKVAFHTDKILATNAIGGPYLLTRLTNQDIRGLLGCGPKTSLDVLQLRNDLRKSQS
jgi:hypothetical protein